MTPHQAQLVRTTFAQIEPFADHVATLFYDRLFEIAPEVRPLFKRDMDQQGMKLMQTIGVAVAHLDNLGAVIPSIQALGKRHAGYGVRPEHYATVGAALLWTLEKGLGDDFTPAVKEAWTEVYHALAATMQEAAYGQPATQGAA